MTELGRPAVTPVHGPPEAEAATQPAERLLVIAPGTEPSPWEGVVTALSEALGLETIRESRPAPPDAPDLVERILERAAAAPGPVLVLPPAPPAGTAPRASRGLGRVLAPFDSDQVSSALRPILHRLQTAGVQVVQLLVVTAETLPAMWDGSGHHALAWHEELRRRHQVGEASVEVASGVPASLVVARAGDTDLVIMCWARRAPAGGAKTLRGVLAVLDVPLLLVPVA
jgi:hypothetical protein